MVALVRIEPSYALGRIQGKGAVAADELCVLSTILSSMSGLGSNYFLLTSEKQRRRSVEEKVITHLNLQSTERSTIEFEI